MKVGLIISLMLDNWWTVAISYDVQQIVELGIPFLVSIAAGKGFAKEVDDLRVHLWLAIMWPLQLSFVLLGLIIHCLTIRSVIFSSKSCSSFLGEEMVPGSSSCLMLIHPRLRLGRYFPQCTESRRISLISRIYWTESCKIDLLLRFKSRCILLFPS